MTAGRHYILILPPLLSNSETSLPIQRVTCRAFFSRVWGLYDCGNSLLFILLERHVFHAFSMESKEGMQDVESWQHLFSHQLHVYVGTYCLDHLPQTREPYLLLVHQRPTTQPQATSEALDSWERCGRGAVEVCRQRDGFRRESGEALVRQPSPSRLVMQFPF